MSEKIIYQVGGAVAIIRLNRPERKNAMDVDSYNQFADALARADADAAVRVMLVAGGEGFFCSGNDVQGFLAADKSAADPLAATQRFMAGMLNAAKPIVAAVSGAAVGIGATMLLHCDLVVLGETARLQFPFVRLGISPEFGSPLLLQRRVGYLRAAEMLMLGDAVDAASALACGLANAVVPEAGLMDAALTRARRLAELPPNALRVTKDLLRQGLRAELPAVFNEENAHVARLMVSAEAREAFNAFLEKRKPDFSNLK